MIDDQSRRSFMKQSAGMALAAAPAVLPALGANDRVKVGWIGSGMRGYHVMNQMYLSSKDNVEVTAVCDTYQGNLAKAKDNVQTKGGNTPKTYVDYKQVLADPNVEVVFICTPEHLHYPMALAALRAGKNIYLEKPIAHTIEEGAEIVKLAEKMGKVVQVGTQNRSNKLYIQAKKMVEDGMIGEVHYVRAFWYRNFEPSEATPAAWRYPIPADTNPENTDFDRFLGSNDPHPAKKVPFSKERYFQWRNYWDYSGGISTDLLVHQTDISNFVLNRTVPMSCMASGGIYMWDKERGDDRDVPDTLSALYEYPDQFHLNYSCYFGNDNYGYGEQFCGYKGTIEVLDRQNLHFFPQRRFGNPKYPEIVKKTPEIHLNYLKDFNQPDATADHVRNFIDAVQGKAKAIAPARAGQIAAVPGHMATLSYKAGKKVMWNEKTEQWKYA